MSRRKNRPQPGDSHDRARPGKRGDSHDPTRAGVTPGHVQVDEQVDDEVSDEAQLFRTAFRDARPLHVDRVEHERKRPKAIARFSRLDEAQVLRESLDEAPHAMEMANGSALSWRHPAVPLRTMRRLARGGISVQDEIDLHGLSAAEAREELKSFIASSMLAGHTCIRIVHGKGLRSGQSGPVLKKAVDHWLRRWEPVLCYVSARPSDGGTGAVYVLLKKYP